MELEFEPNDNKKYKVEAIRDSTVNIIKAKGYLPGLYYLVAEIRYFEEKNIWKWSFAVQNLKKLINFFYKNQLKKATAVFLPINSALPMAKPIFKQTRSSII